MARNLKGRLDQLAQELSGYTDGPPKLLVNLLLEGPDGETPSLETGCWWVTTNPPYQWGIPPLGPATEVVDVAEFLLAVKAVEEDEIEMQQKAEALCRAREEYLARRFGPRK